MPTEADLPARIDLASKELLRELLKDALGALDTIAIEPEPSAHPPEFNHAKADRTVARTTAKRIRDQLLGKARHG